MNENLSIEFDNEQHYPEFIRLNELWISEYFTIEEPDCELAANPHKIITDGGHIISLVRENQVIGVCALFRESAQRYQLARMAVEPSKRRQGIGHILVETALTRARERHASSVFLLSNTLLQPALALYRKHGFTTLSEGSHPVYARCNIILERKL